jgi:Rhs element Vgr protein
MANIHTASQFASAKIRLFAGADLLAGLLVHSVVVSASLNRLATAQIFVIDGDVRRVQFGAANDPRLAPGMEISVIVGEEADGVILFRGLVVRQGLRVNAQVGSLLSLELKHAAVKMSHLRRSVSHLDQTDDEVAHSLAARSGVALEGNLANRPQYENLLQYNVSDWDFLVMRAEACACCVATLPQGIVLLQPRIDRGSALAVDLHRDVLELDAEVDARNQVYATAAAAWDYTDQQAVTGTQEEYGPVSADGNPSRGGMGAALDEEALNLVHSGRHVIDEVQAWADGRILRSELERVRGRLRIWGNGRLQPGSTLVVSGASDALNGPHFVSAVRHELSAEGWTTDIEIGMDGAAYATEFDVNEVPVGGLLAKMPGLQIGIVERLEGDPLGAHRVFVKMKSLPEDQGGIWARVASLDAGKDHGIFFRPQAGDEVVVGFLNEDPRDGIVLGGLFNGEGHKPSFDTGQGYRQQGIVTAAGLRVELDETKEGILLQTPTGDRILLVGKEEGKQGIVLQDQFGNEIALGREGIVIKSAGSLRLEATTNLDLQANGNLNAAAQAKLDLKGEAMGSLSSSGLLEIQGGLVKIN